ncbi:MAG: hypothetical protein ACFCU3_01795, partial [Verrucomicrobiales bacterium]
MVAQSTSIPRATGLAPVVITIDLQTLFLESIPPTGLAPVEMIELRQGPRLRRASDSILAPSWQAGWGHPNGEADSGLQVSPRRGKPGGSALPSKMVTLPKCVYRCGCSIDEHPSGHRACP